MSRTSGTPTALTRQIDRCAVCGEILDGRMDPWERLGSPVSWPRFQRHLQMEPPLGSFMPNGEASRLFRQKRHWDPLLFLAVCERLPTTTPVM